MTGHDEGRLLPEQPPGVRFMWSFLSFPVVNHNIRKPCPMAILYYCLAPLKSWGRDIAIDQSRLTQKKISER